MGGDCIDFNRELREEIALGARFLTRVRQKAGRHILVIALFTLSSAALASADAVIESLAALSDSPGEDVRSALNAARQLAPAERLVLENHLRVRQGAQMMANGHHAEARAILKTVETDSPAAVHAGLLIAESFRLEGATAKAKDWFLRTARFYPYRLQTLEGLMRAAASQRPDNNGLASALYAEIETQARYGLDQLEKLTASGPIDPMAVIFPSDLDEHVRETLLMRCLKYSDKSLLRESAQLQKSVKTVLALHVQHEKLNTELRTLREQLNAYPLQRDHVMTEIQHNDIQIRTLKSQLIANDLSDAQKKIRHRIVQLSNGQTRLHGQLAFIDQASTKLPIVMANIDRRVKSLNDEALSTLKESNRSVSEILAASYESYQWDLSEISAQSAVQRAEMMMSSAK